LPNATTPAEAKHTTANPTHPDLILAICCMSLLLVGMDVTIVNVALPAIQHDLRSTLSGLQWILDAYTLVVASLLMLAGSMSDRFGRRRVFQIGLTLFIAGSFLCSLAHSIHQLVAFRALQGLGASMLNPVALSIIANAFPEPKSRARAVGLWGAVSGGSLAIGPLIGGALTESIGWRSIFWINIPIGLLAIALAARFVPESKAPRARAFDPVGQILVLLVLASLTYAVIEGPRHGWKSPLILTLFTVAATALLTFIFYEPRRAEPLLDLRFFRSVPFSTATLLGVSAFSCFAGFLFLNALYLQQMRGLSAFQSGLCTLPLAIMMMLCSPLSGRLVGSYGSRPSVLSAGAGFLLSTLILTQLSLTTPIAMLLAAYLLFGVGLGMVNPAITNNAVAGMPLSQAGVAAAIASTGRQVGSALGVAIAGTVVTTSHARGLDFTRATHPIWWLMSACGAFILLLGWVSTTAWAKATTTRIPSLALLICLAVSGHLRAQLPSPVPSPEALLNAIHAQSQELGPSDRVDLLYELSIAATAVSRQTSADWAIEMYECATTSLPDPEEQMFRAAQRKNALTVLSLSDPEAAAERFPQLEPSPAHALSEDPRVDLSRHLFPRLWAKNGLRSLPVIRRLAAFTALTGEYPYAAMATLLPKVAQVDRRTAQALFTEAVHQMPSTHPLHRTQDVYIRFLRAAWPIATRQQRLAAVHAGISGAESSPPIGRMYFEYFLPETTVHLESELDAHIYELLPFVDEADRALGQTLRRRYPHVQGLPVLPIDNAPWRAAVAASPGRDTPDLVQRAFERSIARFITTWAQTDPSRALKIALSTDDPTGLALLFPWTENARRDLERKAQSTASPDLLLALIRSEFKLGHTDEAHKLSWLAWKNPESREELEDICGQYWFGDPQWRAETDAIQNPVTRLMLLAKYARGALRNSPGYEEPA